MLGHPGAFRCIKACSEHLSFAGWSGKAGLSQAEGIGQQASAVFNSMVFDWRTVPTSNAQTLGGARFGCMDATLR